MAATNGGCSVLAVAISNNPDRICNRSGNASDATSATDGLQPVLLGWCDAADGGLDLDAGEHGELLAHHVGGDGDGAPADQVSAAACEAEGDQPASVWVGEAADLIAEQPGIGVRAKRQPDLLLKNGFGVGHMIMSAALHCGRA